MPSRLPSRVGSHVILSLALFRSCSCPPAFPAFDSAYLLPPPQRHHNWAALLPFDHMLSLPRDFSLSALYTSPSLRARQQAILTLSQALGLLITSEKTSRILCLHLQLQFGGTPRASTRWKPHCTSGDEPASSSRIRYVIILIFRPSLVEMRDTSLVHPPVGQPDLRACRFHRRLERCARDMYSVSALAKPLGALLTQSPHSLSTYECGLQ